MPSVGSYLGLSEQHILMRRQSHKKTAANDALTAACQLILYNLRANLAVEDDLVAFEDIVVDTVISWV